MCFILGILLLLNFSLPLSAQSTPRVHSHPIIRTGRTSRSPIFGSSVESTNWAGYAVTGAAGSVTNAEGSWIEPSLTCSGATTYAAFWVGIDGYSSSTVEQTGTLGECSGGSAIYYSWYEFYPNPMYEITSVSAAPGNTMYAQVSYSSGTFTTTLTDETTGQSFSTSATVSGAQESSAEWITEAPSSSSGVLPLANFGKAYFGEDYAPVSGVITGSATISGTTGDIASFGSSVQEITQVNSAGTVTLDQPSALSSDGTSFYMTYEPSTTSTTTTSTSTTTTSSTTPTSTSTVTTTSTSTVTTTSTTTPTLSVSVSTSQSSYGPGSIALIIVTVTYNGAAVSGATVSATVTLPNGSTAHGSATTSSSGEVLFIYEIGRHPQVGTYTVSVTASASGYNSGTASTTFQVT